MNTRVQVRNADQEIGAPVGTPQRPQQQQQQQQNYCEEKKRQQVTQMQPQQ